MEKWFIKNRIPEENIDLKKYNLDNILYKILLNRGINTESEIEHYLNPSMQNLNTPLLLPDIIKASNIIFSSIRDSNKIRIVGDYDVDGVMSTYILYNGLKKIGADVDYCIPHRVKDGYGINKNIIDKADADGIDLIITCDNGIAAYEAVDYANEKNIKVIVTDHHEVPLNEFGEEVLPKASAVINPKREGSKYPFKEICGAVVAYKLISYLYTLKSVDENELFTKLLPYAAIATVCDVMPLVNENRDIVSKGLEMLNCTGDTGLKALIKESGLEDKNIGVYHIGFIIGPTVNSAGRLESADYALNLLLCDEEKKAEEMARYLRQLNLERQILTDEGFKKVDDIITKNNFKEKFPVFIVLESSLNESVVGIIAGRIKEKYNRPTIIFTESNGFLKGSGRSIEGYNMFDKISEHKTNLLSFGGHAMACGLSIGKDDLNDFIVQINRDSELTKDDLIPKIYIDMGLNLGKNDIELVDRLSLFEPYGTRNPRATFGTRNLNIIRFSVFGKNKNVLKFILSDGEQSREAILFENEEIFINNLRKFYNEDEINRMRSNLKNDIFIDIVYTPTINNFRGNKNLELSIKNYRISEVAKC